MDNPPAFPLPGIEGQPVNEGMTLRDYFAAKALSGLLANSEYVIAVEREEKENASNKMAEIAYELADAMLKERAKGGG